MIALRVQILREGRLSDKAFSLSCHPGKSAFFWCSFAHSVDVRDYRGVMDVRREFLFHFGLFTIFCASFFTKETVY